MKEDMKSNSDAFYMKIDSKFKERFYIKCIKNKTTMSDVLREYIKEYIEC